MDNEKNLIQEFYEEIAKYLPNWDRIVKTNQFSDRYTDEEAKRRKIESFCSAIKKLREEHNLSLSEMGDRLSYSKQYVRSIETGCIKNVPVEKLEVISVCFSVSVAYLLGLIDTDSIAPDITQYYFWEYPDSRFNGIKDKVVRKGLFLPMATFGAPKETLSREVIELMESDYELLMALKKILSTEKQKKSSIVQIIKNLGKLV